MKGFFISLTSLLTVVDVNVVDAEGKAMKVEFEPNITLLLALDKEVKVKCIGRLQFTDSKATYKGWYVLSALRFRLLLVRCLVSRELYIKEVIP